MQADNSSSNGMLNSQLAQVANQESADGSADSNAAPTKGAPTRGGPAPQISLGSNARGREMLRVRAL